jgi:AbrB family looped-hinge helix DNA binding protein
MPIVAKDGRVTIPKKVRQKVSLRPGDLIEVRLTAIGIQVEKIGTARKHKVRRGPLSKQRMTR